MSAASGTLRGDAARIAQLRGEMAEVEITALSRLETMGHDMVPGLREMGSADGPHFAVRHTVVTLPCGARVKLTVMAELIEASV